MAPKQQGRRWSGTVVTAAGAGMLAAGSAAWLLVRQRLLAEKIFVEKNATRFAGARVAGPMTAYYQADTIGRNALKASDGRTYAELPAGDPAAKTALTASFLRASLFTSVIAFGVAALTGGLGVVLIIVGRALGRTGR